MFQVLLSQSFKLDVFDLVLGLKQAQLVPFYCLTLFNSYLFEILLLFDCILF